MRILIATVTAGGGHLAAAAALDEAWRALRPDDVVERVDVVKFFSPLHRKIHADGYVKLVERAPELWGMIFARTDDPKVARRLNQIQRLFPSVARLRFARFVKKFKPDAVLCTHYEPLAVSGSLKAEGTGSYRALCVSVVTDFEAHALWMEDGVDLYCVAEEETKARLIARGAPGWVGADDSRRSSTNRPSARIDEIAPFRSGAVIVPDTFFPEGSTAT